MMKSSKSVLALHDITFTLDDMHSDSAFTAPILIRARALSGFAELVQRLGGDPSALLRSVELSPTQLENSESCISLASVARLLDGTAKALKITDFGLQLAEQQDISVLGAVALIAQYAATVSEALSGIARHLPYHTPNAHLSTAPDPERAGHIRIIYELSMEAHWPRQQTVELSYSVLQRFLLLITGETGADWHISFRHAPGCSATCYAAHFSSSLSFAQEQDALSLPVSLLDTPIGAKDTRLYAAAERFVQNLLRRFPLDVVSQVEGLVERQLATGGVSLQRVAGQLGLHERTLQRRLLEQNCYFEELVDQLRRNRAQTLLRDTALPVAEIAAVLGYSEQSSLNRSCSRWFGTTPLRYRKRPI